MKMGVFKVVDEKECNDNGCKPLMLTWVDKMKGEKCRSRLVCREIKKAKDRYEQLGAEDVFRPMPPSERLKMLVPTMMTVHDDGNHVDDTFEMATWDLSRAHFYGEARRWIYTFLPEGHEKVGKLARLCTNMYGTRDSASIWGDTWSDVLKESSMKVGTACPAFFCCCDGDFKGLCHGGVFCMVARQKQLQTFGKVLEKRFEVKQTGHIGFGVNDKKELKFLKRTIRIDVLNDEMTLEADTKLVENASESIMLKGSKGVESPRVRRTGEQTAQIENSEELTSAESTLYRSLVKKLAYVSQDRVDIAKAVKCLTRHMKEPRSGHMQELKKVGSIPSGDQEFGLEICLERKSTTGVIVKRGKHWLRHMSFLQTLVALSSGEAEHYALIRGACTRFGFQSHYQDWMIVPKQIYSDSSAAISVARRRGIGGRHNTLHVKRFSVSA